MNDTPTTADLLELVEALTVWVPALLDEPQRAAAIVSACRAAAANLEVDGHAAFADAVARVEAAAQAFSRHLLLFVDPDGALVPDDHDHGWPPPDPRQIRRLGGGVSGVQRSDDGIVLFTLSSLQAIDFAEPQIDAAIALSQGATGLILDLRQNGGGDPGTVARIAGFVLGHPSTHLSTVHGRDGQQTVWETDPPARSLCVPDDVKVAVLTSRRTFSSAEALAYHLRVRRRVTIIGETTPGAADHVSPFVLTRFVHAQLPIARVIDAATNSNWEGTGVRADVECDPWEAHGRALEWLRSSPPD